MCRSAAEALTPDVEEVGCDPHASLVTGGIMSPAPVGLVRPTTGVPAARGMRSSPRAPPPTRRAVRTARPSPRRVTLGFLMDSIERKGMAPRERVLHSLRRAGYLFFLAFAFRLQLWVFTGFPAP